MKKRKTSKSNKNMRRAAKRLKTPSKKIVSTTSKHINAHIRSTNKRRQAKRDSR